MMLWDLIGGGLCSHKTGGLFRQVSISDGNIDGDTYCCHITVGLSREVVFEAGFTVILHTIINVNILFWYFIEHESYEFIANYLYNELFPSIHFSAKNVRLLKKKDVQQGVGYRQSALASPSSMNMKELALFCIRR